MLAHMRTVSHWLPLRAAFSKLTTKVDHKIGFIYLNSEKDFNALSVEMKAQLIQSVKKYEADPAVKVMVILSTLKKAFCAGANIKEFEGKSSKDFHNNDIFKELHDTFYGAKKPIIAGVNGVALGGGFQLALLCDIILCSEDARFALPELKLGLIPGIGGTQRFARIAGRVNAARYILTSEFIAARKALQLGVVSEVYPNEELHQKVTEMAKQITNKPLTAILAAKQAIRANENLSMAEGIALQRKVFYPLFDSEGVKEGVAAFKEKRTPKHIDL